MVIRSKQFVPTILSLCTRFSTIITNKVRSLSESLNNKIMTLSPTIDVLNVIRSGLKVTCCVVAL
jgi:hypothetical protein